MTIRDRNRRSALVVYFVIFLLGAVSLSGCNSRSPTMSIAAVSTPVVSEVILSSSSDILYPGHQVEIWVNTDVANQEIPITYTWGAEGGEILWGQGTESIMYKTPDRTGDYTISVGVKYGSWKVEKSKKIVVVLPTPASTDTPTPTSTDTPTPTSTDTPTPNPTNTPSPTPTNTPTPSPAPTATATPTNTVVPSKTPTPIPYSTPVLTSPENETHASGTFPPLDWYWDRELGENEYFEVRVWHENVTDYHPALGWVKVPHFDYNITHELMGKYYWTVLVIEGQNARPKDWWKPDAFPYPVWDGDRSNDLSPESEIRSFFYVPPPDKCTNCGSSPGPISCDEPPC